MYFRKHVRIYVRLVYHGALDAPPLFTPDAQQPNLSTCWQRFSVLSSPPPNTCHEPLRRPGASFIRKPPSVTINHQRAAPVKAADSCRSILQSTTQAQFIVNQRYPSSAFTKPVPNHQSAAVWQPSQRINRHQSAV